MPNALKRIPLPFLLAASLAAQSPEFVVAPAAHTTTDALSYQWIAGASQPLRQQTLVGQSHLQNQIGRTIQQLELRRSAAYETFFGGTMHLDITLSTSPRTPLTCDSVYAGNVGADAVQVFVGNVTLPTSPATPSGTGSPVAWSTDNCLRIAFSQPFVYLGGTLCVDIIGQPVAGQEADWWMADAAEEVILGSTVDLGPGCGSHGGPQRRWSQVARRTLYPGARARFWAYGSAGGFAMAAFGRPASSPVPLAALGVPTPGCFSYLDPAGILGALPATFLAEPQPTGGIDAIAELLVPIPADPMWFGLQLTTQWFDFSQQSASNGITWTVASSIPVLDMALNEGHPTEATGLVSTYLAHVMRFEFL